jgi:hypothetical protein
MKTRTRPLVSHWEVGTDGPPKLRLSLPVNPPTVRGADGWALVSWLVIFAAVWATLCGVVPAFDKMFTEVGLSLPVPTEALVRASRFAGTPLGLVVGVAVVLASVGVSRRLREPWVGWAFAILTVFGVAFFPFALLTLLSPLCGFQKL